MKRFILIFILIQLTIFSFSQQLDAPAQDEFTNNDIQPNESLDENKLGSTAAKQQYLNEEIKVKKFDQAKWKDIVGNRDYNRQTLRRKAETDRSEGSDAGGSTRRMQESDDASYDYEAEESDFEFQEMGPLLRIFFYGVIGVVILLILWQVFRGASMITYTKTKTDKILTEEIQDIAELNTEELIQHANNDGNFKLAIRLYFLDILKRLNQNGIIEWTKEKTNRDYLAEVYSRKFHYEELRRLTLAYERIWYGEHIPTEDYYDELKTSFQQFRERVQSL